MSSAETTTFDIGMDYFLDGPKPVAIVTGASKGIGLEVARILAPGYVLILPVRANNVGAMNEMLEDWGNEGRASELDLKHLEQIEDWFRREIDEFEAKPSLLASIAGMSAPKEEAAAKRIKPGTIIDINNVNSTAPQVLTALSIEGIKKAAKERRNPADVRGSIVYASSINGLISNVNVASYAATKAALDRYALDIGLETAPQDTKVISVALGPVLTDIMQKAGQKTIDHYAELAGEGWPLSAEEAAFVVVNSLRRPVSQKVVVHAGKITEQLVVDPKYYTTYDQLIAA